VIDEEEDGVARAAQTGRAGVGWLSRSARLWQSCGRDELSWERARTANTTGGEEVLDGGGGGAE